MFIRREIAGEWFKFNLSPQELRSACDEQLLMDAKEAFHCLVDDGDGNFSFEGYSPEYLEFVNLNLDSWAHIFVQVQEDYTDPESNVETALCRYQEDWREFLNQPLEDQMEQIEEMKTATLEVFGGNNE